jgi:hypothetical protein
MNLRSLVFCATGTLACIAHAQSSAPLGCIPIDSARYQISRPGLYCVTKDLNTRLDFPDHPAEMSIIEIGVGDVTLDLQGHRIGRGRIITQRGGNGILITTGQLEGERGASPRIKNVTIRNGVLADFRVGIQYVATAYQRPTLSHQVRQTDNHSFIYDEANVVMENLKYERCDQDMSFQDWAIR